MLMLNKKNRKKEMAYAFTSGYKSFNVRAALRLKVLLALGLSVFFTNVLLAQTEKDKPSFQFTNKLGVTATAPLQPITIENTILNKFLDAESFLLRIADGIYMAIPFKSFRQSELIAGTHVVTLTNGQRPKGKLLGKVTSSDFKTYSLGSTTKLLLVGMPKTEQKQPGKVSKNIWKLEINKPLELIYSVSDPRFGFTYNFRYKRVEGIFYKWETVERKIESRSFSIRVQGELIPAHIDDFEEISLRQLQNEITLKSASGVETPGDLILQTEEGQKVKNWLFMADVNDNLGMIIMSTEPTILKITK